MIQSVLSVKAPVLVGLLAGFASVLAFKSLAQKMHSALVFLLRVMHQLDAPDDALSLLYIHSIAVWP